MVLEDEYVSAKKGNVQVVLMGHLVGCRLQGLVEWLGRISQLWGSTQR